MFALFSVRHRLESDARIAGCARGVGTHGEGPS
jgi:hypothetical protein